MGIHNVELNKIYQALVKLGHFYFTNTGEVIPCAVR